MFQLHGIDQNVIVIEQRENMIDNFKAGYVASLGLGDDVDFWSLKGTDTNIDHRRVPNLQRFFSRFGEEIELPQTSAARDFSYGDVVAWRLPHGATHIGGDMPVNTDGGCLANGEPIGVSERATLIDSVLGTGFACVRSDLEHDNLPYFNKILPNIRGIRRYGSCAIDLSYVACGRLEGFWELNLNLYDMAAGMLILREAGGRVTDFSGDTRDMPGQLVATNGLIHEELLGYLSTAN